jgi:hypothetical protein
MTTVVTTVTSKVNSMFLHAKIRKGQMKDRFAQKFLQKHEGIDGIIVALILIVIAVGIGIFFRNTIMDVLSSALNTVQSKISALFSGTSGGVS